jgi:hypothetical protein
MKSKLAEEAEQALIEATQKLSPEERLNAFLEHCQLVMELYEAGKKIRAADLRQPPSSTHSPSTAAPPTRTR